MKKLDDLLLYAVTEQCQDEALFLKKIKDAINGGISVLQLREKNITDEAFFKLASHCQSLCKEKGIPFIVNDRVDIAKKIGADGVHVGQSDLACGKVRALLGDEVIVGVSARTVEDAVLAEKNGADYLGVGAVFQTSTKHDAKGVSFEVLKEIVSKVSIPVVAIGGITGDNMDLLKDSGVCGVAVVSAIFAKDDIAHATKELKEKTRLLFGGK